MPQSWQADLLGSPTESCLAVHSGSSGTGFWNRNQSRPGVECRVQYSRAWFVHGRPGAQQCNLRHPVGTAGG
jgi:hypothetical protein